MPLLKTLAELKDFVSVDIPLSAAADIPPHIRMKLVDVERKHVAAILGPLAPWLQAQYNAPEFDPADPDSLAAELLRLVQAPIARIGTALGLTAHQARISSTGVQIQSTGTHKTAFQWQVDELRADGLLSGLADLDMLVQWLEDNHDSADELRPWGASEAGQRHRQELFTCTADFHHYENIQESRHTFLALSQVRRRAEDFHLAPVLSDAFLQELRDQVRGRTLTSENKNLLRAYVYPALASLTMAKGIPELGLRLSGNGVELIIARTDTSNAKEADLSGLMKEKALSCTLNAQRYLQRLRDFLNREASPTRFATYFTSSAYTSPAYVPPPSNTADSRIYKFT